jgi:phage terminase large subunit
MSAPRIIKAEMPACAEFLAQPHRFKAMWGGRNGVKTWSMGRQLVIRGASEPIRWLCCREIMKTIKESVHTVLEDQIKLLGLERFYDIQSNAIYGHNGTRFVYAGLRSLIQDATALKAYESFDGAWLEEAQTVSKASLRTLIPTIRKAGSEIWFSLNPELESDPIVNFLFKQPPPGLAIHKTSYRDNLWISAESQRDMDHLRATNPDEFEHVYEGGFVSQVEGAIFGKEMRDVTVEGRELKVPYDPTRPVYTFWDIGDRFTSIWFAQVYPLEYHIIDYVDDEALSLDRYFKILSDKPYVYARHVLPADAKAPQLATGKTIEQQARGIAGRDKIQILPIISLASQINAARTILPRCYFDAEKCADGLRGLRHYRWPETSAAGVEHDAPMHDWACFHPDTLVLTRYGTQRIIDLPKNGEVLTPCGWKRYQGPKITRKDAQLVEVVFKDGFTVKCTPDHLFQTENGWKSAESLTKGFLIQSTLTHSHNISMVDYIGYGQVKPTLLGAAKNFIAMFGKLPLVQFQTNAISTTKTAMFGTTCLPILNVCPRLNIQGKQGIGHLPHSLASAAWLGIGQKKEDYGTEDTRLAMKDGQNGNEKTNLVFNVARYLAHLLVQPFRKNTAHRYVGALRVESVSWIDQRVDTYCINVPEGECFSLANGAVVHNSHPGSAFQYLAVGIKDQQLAPKAKPQAQQTYTSAWS